MSMLLKRGMEFDHQYYLDGHYGNYRPLRMRVTYVTPTAVYYCAAESGKGKWVLDRDMFEQRYMELRNE